MSNQIVDRIINNPGLPTLPAVAVRVLELTSQPDVAIGELGSAVSLDQAMVGKILKTVNSSYYGLAKPVGSIERAMAYLGMNTVKTLVLSFSLIDNFGKVGLDEDAPVFDASVHWRRAIYSATAARLIAEAIGEIDADDAFIAALMQDVGVLAMFVELKDAYANAIAGVPHSGSIEAERIAFDTNHTLVGEALCKKWRIPAAITIAIRDHHAATTDTNTHDPISITVRLAGLTAESLIPGGDAIALRRLQNIATKIPILADSIDDIVRKTAEGGEELSRIFRIDTGESVDPSRVLADAGDMLVQHQVMADRRSSELERANHELRVASETDKLTGTHNRGFFDAALARAFGQANAENAPISIIFFDADRFKVLNDTHGHAAGDAVLIQLAERAGASIGDNGLVCRYGGEEFAIIMPGHDRKAAGLAAEKLRRAVEATPFDVRGTDAKADELPVTISIGVAAFEPSAGHRFHAPERLLLAADKAVYAAKRAGRNCVRIFSPKVGDSKGQPHTRTAPKETLPTAQQCSSHTDTPIRLMLVEDDTMHAMLMGMIGKALPAVTIEIVRTAEQAIQHLCDHRDRGQLPDAILCDLGLPGMSGFELLQWIRCELPAGLPAIVVTASEDHINIERSMSVGASAFISKPEICAQPKQALISIIEEWCIPKQQHQQVQAA